MERGKQGEEERREKRAPPQIIPPQFIPPQFIPRPLVTAKGGRVPLDGQRRGVRLDGQRRGVHWPLVRRSFGAHSAFVRRSFGALAMPS